MRGRLLLVALSFYSLATFAMSGAEQAAIDTYLSHGTKTGSSSVFHLRKSMLERFKAVETRLNDVFYKLKALEEPYKRRLAIVNENTRVHQNTDINVYNDPAWIDPLIRRFSAACCRLIKAGADPAAILTLPGVRAEDGKSQLSQQERRALKKRLKAERKNRAGEDGEGDEAGE